MTGIKAAVVEKGMSTITVYIIIGILALLFMLALSKYIPLK